MRLTQYIRLIWRHKLLGMDLEGEEKEDIWLSTVLEFASFSPLAEATHRIPFPFEIFFQVLLEGKEFSFDCDVFLLL